MPELRRLREGDLIQFADFLSAMSSDEQFRPHDMDVISAIAICHHDGKDRFCGYFDDDGTMVAYGILRGWDDGFEHPSLGIAVHHVHQGLGHGLATMEALHAEARRLGTTRIRLRVHPSNRRARSLYEKMGYEFSGEMDRGDDVGWYTVPDSMV